MLHYVAMRTRFTIIAVCLVVDIILSAIFASAYFFQRDVLTLWMGKVLAMLYVAQVVAMCFFWHRAWRSIQDPYARTTPGKAIGFMFIPLLNLYWVFVLMWGFAKDYNAFCWRYKIGSPPHHLRAGFFLTVVLMWIVSVFLRYASAIGVLAGWVFVRYAPIVSTVYGICFSLAMLVLLYKTARAVTMVQRHDMEG